MNINNFDTMSKDSLLTLKASIEEEIERREREDSQEYRLEKAVEGNGYQKACEQMIVAYIIFNRIRKKYGLDDNTFKMMVDSANTYANEYYVYND